MTVVSRTSESGAQDVLELLRLICLLAIMEEKDKNPLTYPEPVPRPALMEVYVWSSASEAESSSMASPVCP